MVLTIPLELMTLFSESNALDSPRANLSVQQIYCALPNNHKEWGLFYLIGIQSQLILADLRRRVCTESKVDFVGLWCPYTIPASEAIFMA